MIATPSSRSSCLVVAALLCTVAAAQAMDEVGRTVPFDLAPASMTRQVSAGDLAIFEREIHQDGATFLKVHFSLFRLTPGETLELYDGDRRLVASYSAATPPTRSGWSFAADGDTLRLVYRQRRDDPGTFAVDGLAKGALPLTGRSICGSNDMEESRCYDYGAYKSNSAAVGRLLFEKSGSWYVCTGFLISSADHFLTNEHCISSQSVCDTLEVRFDYERESCSASAPIAQYSSYACDTFLTSDYSYDFGLLTLAGHPYGTWGALSLDPRPVAANENIYILQHPGGNPQKISFGVITDPNAYGRTYDSDFAHRADTEGGSSGSPVFDADDQVIGLHHLGGCSSTGGENSAVRMENVYPRIASYLPGASGTVEITD